MQAEEAATRRLKRAHRDFWKANGRLAAFQSAATDIWNALGLQYVDLEARIVPLVGSTGGDQSRTLARYITAKTVNPRDYSIITALCIVVGKTCQESSAKLAGHQAAADGLVALAAEVRQAGLELVPLAVSTPTGGKGYTRDDLRRLLDAIEVPKKDNPQKPEFPPNTPRFPATPEVFLQTEPFTLIIKDESWNPTGSHKDRWAWEKLLWYRAVIQEALETHGTRKALIQLPAMSMISSGSAAFALQTLLRLHGLPPLRVVMDGTRTDEAVMAKLRSIGALVYTKNLDDKFLDAFEVLDATANVGGLEITTRDIATPGHQCFYDWLVCEILLLRPTYIFVPFGTGDLFTNILTLLADEASPEPRDKRIEELTREELRGIHVLGATTNEPSTRMDKLFAKFRPTEKDINAKLADLIEKGVIGDRSAIIPIDDRWASQAQRVARDHNVRTELSGIAGLGLFRAINEQLSLTTKDVVVIVNTGWMHVPDT
jgi:hypothetical protein